MQPTLTNRRDLLALGGASVLFSLAGEAQCAEGSADEPSSIERENEKLDTIVDYFDDKIVYQMFEGMPDIKGKEAFIKRIEPFFANIERIQWDIVRSHAIGNLVINERVDHFYRKDDKPDMHFPVAGFFVVKNGKIHLWRDYSMPKPIENEEK